MAMDRYESLSQAARASSSRLIPKPANTYGSFSHEYEGDGSSDRLSVFQLIGLSASLLGAQLVWSIETGSGTPYLLSLGLSKPAASLVWLAAPVSGCIAQPLIGAYSDADQGQWRRRKYILLSTLCITIFALLAAYCKAIAYVLVSIFGHVKGDWDPRLQEQINDVAKWIAIIAFWLLDLSLNALQAISRALVLDTVPTEQQSSANAWHSRLAHVGNITGYFLGFLQLSQTPIIRHIPSGQFAKLTVCATGLNIILTIITCLSTEENANPEHHEETPSNSTLQILMHIKASLLSLPKPIQKVCITQGFSWMGWFALLFFGSTWVAEEYQLNHPNGDTETVHDRAVRSGSLALLYQACTALVAAFVLPAIRDFGRSDFVERRPQLGKVMRKVTLKNIWTSSQILFVAVMLSSYNVSTVKWASIVIALTGICFSVSCWIPFAMVMEMIREYQSDPIADERQPNEGQNARQDIKAALTDRRPPITRTPTSNSAKSPRASGATILGIHNLSIVIPQFLTSLIASMIFRITATANTSKPDVVYVFLFGALTASAAVVASRYVPTVTSDLRS